MKIILTAVSITLTSAFITPVFGDIKTEISKCSAIENSVSRINCFDILAKSEKLTTQTIQKKSVSKWVLREDISLIDDTKTVKLFMSSENEIKGTYSETISPTLVLICENNKTNAYVNVGIFLGSDSLKATSRLDKNKSRKQTWSISTDHMAMFARKPISFIKDLTKHNRLLLEFIPYGDNRRLIEYDIRGLKEVIKPLQKACNWSSAKKSNVNKSKKKLTKNKSPQRKISTKKRKMSQASWKNRIQNHVERRWHAPPGTKGSLANVKITVSNSGFLSDGINVQSCKGKSEFCSSVREAFERSEPLPRPPNNISKVERTITLTIKN